MEKKILVVPKGIRFLSEWKEFGLPNFPCIIDKKIPGCGFTEFCITSKDDVVLCSPRKLLLKNKEKQHPNEVFYVCNTHEQDELVDKDLEKITKSGFNNFCNSLKSATDAEKERQVINDLKQQIKDYIYYCNGNGKPIKLLVTYDSFRYIKEVLAELGFLDRFKFIVDEFQSIFIDSRFKPSTELEFLYHLQDLQNVSFVSATPMIDEYLEQLDEFKNLPYFELDWTSDDPGRVLKPDLKIKMCRSLNEAVYNIIKSYLVGDFVYTSYKDQNNSVNTIYSKEAVFYVNSVANIIGIINKCGLKPEQCNIIVANTSENLKKIKKRLGKEWEIGEPPLQGEPHKMFTFCTRTVYLGADFYSTCARTFILSDANIDTLSVDISLDLPQILGRQRNLENPWKNRAEFYYKTALIFQNPEEFEKFIEEKLRRTDDLLRTYSITDDQAKTTLAEKFRESIGISHYKNDYLSVNEHMGNVLVPCLNKLVMLAERRAFDIQQIDYKDRFSVFSTICEKNMISQGSELQEFLDNFESLKTFREKMKSLCENQFSEDERLMILDQIPLIYKTFYTSLGPTRCKALSYNKNELEQELTILKFDINLIKKRVISEFSIGDIIPLGEAKKKLQEIYNSLDYKKLAKSTDLNNFYETSNCKKRFSGKQIDCIKINKLK